MNLINNEKDMILLSLKDFFTIKMLKYSIAPFIVTLILMYILFFVLAGMGVDQLAQVQVQTSETTIQNGIPHTESFSTMLEGSAIIKFLMSYAVTSWIATFLIYAIGSFLVLYVSKLMLLVA